MGHDRTEEQSQDLATTPGTSATAGASHGGYLQRKHRDPVIARLAVLFAIPLALDIPTANAQWMSRTVTEVGGTFASISPTFGYEHGLGTSKIEWGLPNNSTSVTSFLQFNPYDAVPGVSQPWYSPGQTVMPGWIFDAGTITFRNGNVSASSSAPNLAIDLAVSIYGLEFYIDNHPLLLNDTWRINVVQTPNGGTDPVADADYIYFADFPHLGRLCLFEGQTDGVTVFAKFGSIEPAGFGSIQNPNAGVVLPLPGTVPVDIEPQTCPNPLDVNDQGLLRVAIVGTPVFQVTDIDPYSVIFGGVPPVEAYVGGYIGTEDVAAPFTGTIGGCDGCSTSGPDGIPDLVLHFEIPSILMMLSWTEGELSDGQCLVLTLEGVRQDGTYFRGWDTVRIVADVNRPPVADAGDDQQVAEGTPVTLDGSASQDPDGDSLTYAWSQLSGPSVTLSDPNIAAPSFASPLVSPGGEALVFRLDVADSDGESASDTVTIQIQNAFNPPECNLAAASPAMLWPPDHKLLPVDIVSLTDPDNDQFTIVITTVTQDEPTNGLGDGDAAPDAVIQEDGRVLLRAERSGNGDGRVYVVHFTATDERGEGCTGSVRVTVAHSLQIGPIDSGQSYDALQQ